MIREIKRDRYLEQLIARKHNGLIKIVTGIRRCGKSYLLRTLFRTIGKGSGKCYIQSAYMLSSEEKTMRGIRPFLKIKDAFKKIVITSDTPKPCYDENGILMMNIFDFLLRPELIEI